MITFSLVYARTLEAQRIVHTGVIQLSTRRNVKPVTYRAERCTEWPMDNAGRSSCNRKAKLDHINPAEHRLVGESPHSRINISSQSETHANNGTVQLPMEVNYPQSIKIYVTPAIGNYEMGLALADDSISLETNADPSSLYRRHPCTRQISSSYSFA